MTATDMIPIKLSNFNDSDDAQLIDLDETLTADQHAEISRGTLMSLHAAAAMLHANTDFEEIVVSSDMHCPSLEAALDSADWLTGDETFRVQRFGGLYLRLVHKHNRQAEIEFDVSAPDGTSLLTSRS